MRNIVVLVVAFILAISSALQTAEAQLLIIPPYKLSPDNFFDAEGISICISPIHPDQLAAGSNVNYYYYSTDKGHTWNANALKPTFGDAGDPSVTCDSRGIFYYAHQSSAVDGVGYNQDRIVVQRSTDGGLTYSVGASAGLDRSPKTQYKEWITADISPTSPNKDNLYLTWTEFDSYQSHFPQFDSTRILFSSSNDSGNTWSAPVTVSDKEGDTRDGSNTLEGARCITGPGGEIYVTWEGADGLMFDKSSDGGKTFGRDKQLTQLVPGWRFDVSGIYRCNGFATPLCDCSNLRHRGNVYVLFSDKRNGIANTDIFMLRSRDGGETWDGPVRVNNDTTQSEQFFPSAAIDQVTGFIYVLFYDRRNYPGTNLTEVYLARSIDGGQSFENYRLGSIPFNPNNNIYIGDYTHIAAQNTYVYPTWTDIQTKDDGITYSESVWIARVIDTGAFNLAVKPTTNTLESNTIKVNPNPARSTISFSFGTVTNAGSSLQIVDVTGRIVAKITLPINEESISYDVSLLPSGVYTALFHYGEAIESLRFTVSH